MLFQIELSSALLVAVRTHLANWILLTVLENKNGDRRVILTEYLSLHMLFNLLHLLVLDGLGYVPDF